MDQDLRVKAEEFIKRVNSELPGTVELEFEGIYKRGIFVTKKRYAMIDEEGKIDVKGLEFVRRDWAAIARKTQEKALEAVLEEGDPSKAADIVRETIDAIRSGDVSLEDLTIYTQLTKPFSEYKAEGPHVAAARKAKKRGRKVEEGAIIGYIVRRGGGSISDRAEPVEDVEEKGFDYDPQYYIDNQVLPAVMRVMEALGYDEMELKTGVRQARLF